MRILTALIASAATSGCVPMMVSYYAPDPMTGATVDNSCGWPNVVYSAPVGNGATVQVQTSPRDRVSASIAIKISGNETARLSRDFISVTGDALKAPIILKLKPFGKPDTSKSASAELRGPGTFFFEVDDPSDKTRPDRIWMQLPDIAIGPTWHSIPAIEYKLKRKPSLVAPCG